MRRSRRPSSRSFLPATLLVLWGIASGCPDHASLADAGATTPADAGASADAGDPTPMDAGPCATEPTQCSSFAGVYLPANATCRGMGLTPPVAICIEQQGCRVTVTTDLSTYTGCVAGSTLLASSNDVREGSSLLTNCTGTQSPDGGLNLDCHTTGPGFDAACTVPATSRARPTSELATCCDLFAQDCGAGNHCTLTFSEPTNAGSPQIAACTATTAVAHEGDRCRTDPDTSQHQDLGYDNCAAGLLCTNYGSPDKRCRRFCISSSECQAPEVCVGFGVDAPAAGVCLPPCTPMGSDCPSQMTCRAAVGYDGAGNARWHAICSAVGTEAIGAACQSRGDCPANSDCLPDAQGADFRCRAYCAPAQGCGAQSCRDLMLQGDLGALGACDP